MVAFLSILCFLPCVLLSGLFFSSSVAGSLSHQDEQEAVDQLIWENTGNTRKFVVISVS